MKKENKIIWLCCLVYFTSYMTRINYGAVIVELIDKLNITSSLAGIALTCSFVSYGLGQLISGFLGDKLNPKLLVFIGLLTTACSNLFVGLSENIYFIIVIWTINGFAQALLWPPLVKIMTQTLMPEQYKKGCAFVTMAASVATIIIYLFAPVCIQIYNYKLVFFASALMGIITAFVWYATTKSIAITDTFSQVRQSNANVKLSKMIITTGILPIMVVLILQGLLRDGIMTWMPTFISDNFPMSTSISILTTTILPIFAVISIYITRLMNKKMQNDFSLSTIIWGVAFASASALFLFMNNISIAVIALSILTACMHGINLLLIGNLPAKFAKYGKVSSMSGVLNSCTYIGSATSAYGIAKLNEAFGWNITIACWIVIIVIGFVLTALSIKKFHKI